MYVHIADALTVVVRLEEAEMQWMAAGDRDESGNTIVDRARFLAETYARSEDPEDGHCVHTLILCAPNGQRIHTLSL